MPALRGVPVAGVAGDQQAALVGLACFPPYSPRTPKARVAFCSFTPAKNPSSRVTVFSLRSPGASARRARSNTPSRAACSAAAPSCNGSARAATSSSAPPTSTASPPARATTAAATWFPPFVRLGAPPGDATARGAIVGLTRGSSAALVARAALESIADQSADLLTAMEADAQLTLRAFRVDGGVTVDAALIQFQSDLLRVPVIRPRITETTALGAAFLAGLAVGFWTDRAELARLTRREKIARPRAPHPALKKLQRDWLRSVERTNGWAQ